MERGDGRQRARPAVTRRNARGHDAIGGFFALNGGRWDSSPGSVHYLAPDTFKWEPFNVGYSDLLMWALSPKLDEFYGDQRWPGWEDEVAAIGADQALAIYPPLVFEETPRVDRSRRPVPARELWFFIHEMGRQLSGIEPGQQVRFDVRE